MLFIIKNHVLQLKKLIWMNWDYAFYSVFCSRRLTHTVSSNTSLVTVKVWWKVGADYTVRTRSGYAVQSTLLIACGTFIYGVVYKWNFYLEKKWFLFLPSCVLALTFIFNEFFLWICRFCCRMYSNMDLRGKLTNHGTMH